MGEPTSVTGLLLAYGQGRSEAFEQLVPLVYQHLHRLARRELRRRPPGETLHTTALVHEAYLKLVDQKRISWQDRSHFYAASAQAMRHILVDAARRRLTAKRGEGRPPEALDSGLASDHGHDENVLAVDQALGRLATIDPRLCGIVECRFFAGMTDQETADALLISKRTVQRGWLRARSWLRRHLDGDLAEGAQLA